MTVTTVMLADDPWDHGMMDGSGWMSGAWAGLGWLLGLLVVLLVLAVVGATVWLVVRTAAAPEHPGRGPARPPAGGTSPRDILAERYARGEIDTAEYTERLRHLTGGRE